MASNFIKLTEDGNAVVVRIDSIKMMRPYVDENSPETTVYLGKKFSIDVEESASDIIAVIDAVEKKGE